MRRSNAAYYSARDPLGRDFTTSPEISQMFGELIGLWLAQVWMDQGAPSAFTLAELGPGRGTLMADLLRATARVPGFHAGMDLHLVETSPVLRAEQARRVEATWSDEAAFPDGPLFVIANEFFDALAIAQYQRIDTAWRERLVTPELEFVYGKPMPDPALGQLFPDAPDGALVEVNQEATAISKRLQAHIERFGGAALFIDYGDWRGTGDTLQALKEGAPVEPLKHLGTADLTAHVQFAQLLGPCRSSFTEQGKFLERLGITERAKTLAKSLEGAQLESHIEAHRRLVHPDEMGSLFKVMGLARADAPPLPGFD